MKKAIAYIRFSSDEQADGNSIERQEGNIKRYAERSDLKLVETLIDDGLSASKGHHIARGKFGSVFLANLAKYKSHALIVEELDRLDRRGIEETRTLLASMWMR
jgi:DNA invertase Pin-like site-specific DNA recombinase